MGYSAYSYCVFGIKMSLESVQKSVKERVCHHDIPDNAKFCPTCGKPAYEEYQENVIDPFEIYKLSYFFSSYDFREKNGIVLGFCIAKTGYSTDCDFIECITPTNDMIKIVMDFCKEYNLPYNEKDCKTYIMTYHSY